MQPDYNQLWRNNNGQATEEQFYAFFEDSLNRFISTSSGSNQPDESKQPLTDDLHNHQQNSGFIKD